MFFTLMGCESIEENDIPIIVDDSTYEYHDIDGNGYDTVKIGNQVWLAQNLRVTHFRNGEPIPTGFSTTELSHIDTSACMIYEDDSSNIDDYGLLYNWYAVTDVRNISPEGWHIPSNNEWEILINYLGGDTIAGGKLKEIDTQHWRAPNTGATNESGFTGLPGGWFSGYGGFYGSKDFWGTFYSSTEHDFANAYAWGMRYNDSQVDHGIYYKQAGRSVRCIKD